MKKRLCIFSFYDNVGYVDDYVLYLLGELKTVLSRLIIVVNGELDTRGEKLFQQYTNEIYVRKNIGFDAGAYKDILLNYLSVDDLNCCDEVILCNDTFFGPFVSMCDVFSKMEEKECDVWGLNGYLDTIFAHIQSYFLVFRKRTFKLLFDYFRTYIDSNTVSLNCVYCQFESGIFDFLTRENGMRCAIFADGHNLDIYRLSYAALSKYNVPIVKKKAFENVNKDKDNIFCTLSYIKYNTNYDIGMILKSVSRKYGAIIDEKDIKEIDYYNTPLEKSFPVAAHTERQIEEFIGNDEFYIYGAGIYAHKVYWRFGRQNGRFRGFIVSDNQTMKESELFGCPIYRFSEVSDIYAHKIILGVGVENAEIIRNNFTDLSKVLSLF